MYRYSIFYVEKNISTYTLFIMQSATELDQTYNPSSVLEHNRLIQTHLLALIRYQLPSEMSFVETISAGPDPRS